VIQFAEEAVFHILSEGLLIAAAGIPVPRKAENPKVFDAIALHTTLGDVYLTGNARDVRRQEEAFFLTATERDYREYLEKWSPMDLALMLGIFKEIPRDLTLYFDPEDLLPDGQKVCAAVRVSWAKQQLVLYATPAFPTCIELCTDTARQRDVLRSHFVL
jgi:hypothetical protein